MSELLFTKPVPPRFFDTNTLDDTQTKTNNWKVFMWLFLAQDAMMFFTLFAGYIGLRISDPAQAKTICYFRYKLYCRNDFSFNLFFSYHGYVNCLNPKR